MSAPDPADELRDKILALTYKCPRGEYTPACPFSMLKGLSHESRRNTLSPLGYPDMVRLFDLAHNCQCPEDPRIGPAS